MFISVTVTVSLGGSFCTDEMISVETIGVMQYSSNASLCSFPMLSSSCQWLEFVLAEVEFLGMLALFKDNRFKGDCLEGDFFFFRGLCPWVAGSWLTGTLEMVGT